MMGSESHEIALSAVHQRIGAGSMSNSRRHRVKASPKRTKRITRGGLEELIRFPDFARRFEVACEGHPHIPDLHRGRLTWIADQFAKRFGDPISIESVRKWSVGHSLPRPEKMTNLAELLEVDADWLARGTTPDLLPDEKRVRSATVNGAVNLVAGLIQMSGGHPAFPSVGSELEKIGADLTAVIRGGLYTFHVALANESDEGYLGFTIPKDFAKLSVVGVVQKSPISHEFLLFDTEGLKNLAERKGGYYVLRVTERARKYSTASHQWERISNFGGMGLT
jgi:hypothetical protein